ncbi:hypothetical protein Q9R38_26080 [Priestia aryabhattai]|uniref:hypothetical protein n=1 Tax=Priestia aryabhattai TaxID=412384 RepID=UPI002881BF24|nr:hypothetical protein [Priestia aryabhattai]MDT0150013.1 hypothetical protein [Priestia aryabhattai]MDT0155583.1 hypothetical protein [Priestia aryabhattai]
MEKVQSRKVVVYDNSNGKMLERMDLELPAMRSITGFLKGEWNLDAYSNSFGGKNRLGDFDASIEIDGHHLVVEFKEHKKTMNAGQLVKAVRMAKHCNTTTFFVFGRTNKPVEKMIISPKVLQGEFTPTSEKELNFLFSKWYSKAKLNPVAKREELQNDWEIANSILSEVK